MRSHSNLSKVVFVSLLVVGSRALAVGGPDQGTLFAGVGVDWQRTATEFRPVSRPEPVPPTLPAYPPKIGMTYVVGAARLKMIKCDNPDANQFVRCDAEATLEPKHEPSQFCSAWLSRPSATPPPKVSLYALNGRPDDSGGFKFQNPAADSKEVTFACAAANPHSASDAEWHALGAIGKCLLWPKMPPIPPATSSPSVPPTEFPPATSSANDRFLTCLRTVRADYCGQGVTYTKDGTLVDIYDKAHLGSHQSQPAFVLEANWNQHGAICLIHPRYLSLAPDCQATFPNELTLAFGGKEKGAGATLFHYHCRKALEPKVDEKCDSGGRCATVKVLLELLNDGVLWDDSLVLP